MIPKIIPAIIPNYQYNNKHTAPSFAAASFGKIPNGDAFVREASKKISLPDAITQITGQITSGKLDNTSIALLDTTDIWKNLQNLKLDIEKKVGYTLRLSFNNTDGSNGSLHFASGTAAEVRAKLMSKEYIEKFERKLDNYSYHFNDNPEIID